jgi:DNA-binding transcriptional LysR family regulator
MHEGTMSDRPTARAALSVMPDLAQLQVLAILLQELSLTRTADQLGMSQPTVSRVLARLRQHFGDPLFVRSGQRMQPTTRALELAEPLAAVLAGVRQLQAGAAVFDPATSTRSFRLHMVEGGTVHVLPRILKETARIAPGVRIRAIQSEPHALAQQLEQGKVDLALGCFPGLVANIHQRPLWLERYATVMRRGHPGAAALDRAAFLDQRHVLVSLADPTHAYAAAERILAAMLPPAAVLCLVPSFSTAAHIALHTDAVATLPRRLAHSLAADLGMEVVDTPVTLPPLQVALYWHERCHRDPGNRWLRGLVRMALCERPGDA